MTLRNATLHQVPKQRVTTATDHRERILRVLTHLQQHLDDPLDVDLLARVAALSPFHFHRVFRGMVGESVMEHVRRLRLERAATRLRFGDSSVVDVALEAGYEAHEAFTRAFRSHFACSPSEFRKEQRMRRYPKASSGVHYGEGGAVATFQAHVSAEVRSLVKVHRRTETRVAFIRHVGPYQDVGGAWGRLMEWAGARGLLMSPSLWGLSYDDPEITAPQHVRYEACIEVDDQTRAMGDVGVQTLAAGEFAVAVHRGPFSSIGDTYAAVMGGWAPTMRRQLGEAPSLERYLTDPRTTPPEQQLTEIWVRLSPEDE